MSASTPPIADDADRFLQLTRRFDVAPERVFDAWLDPDTARKWLFAVPALERYHIEAEARVGGRWTITARRGGIDYTALGEYLEIDRPRRLVFTFAMPQFSPFQSPPNRSVGRNVSILVPSPNKVASNPGRVR
ncbi:MAG: SRPBCC domain-containing protein [Chloroflexota bacterium]|nr:SRPBCC domain-containing protein [Chloroflexota bacterium]